MYKFKKTIFYLCFSGPIFLKNQQNQTLHTVFAQMGGLLLQMLLSCKLYFSKVADFCNFLPTYFPLHPLRKPRVKHLSKRGKENVEHFIQARSERGSRRLPRERSSEISKNCHSNTIVRFHTTCAWK